jgi:tetratricopeptide (TPR) repeat protein
MELVRGIPITEYCDRAQLTTRERLDLFIKVCRAIQHAHQKGIIHRDIKPTNVLVTQIDGAAVPKVIDFGVAKAINQQLTEQTLYTAHSQMIGTPLYMSPEQAQMSGVDIDTRSDVYSLGVLLYELLTGSTPFDKQTLKQAGFDEMRRIIREEEPPRPSDRISTLHAEALSTVSTQRNIDSRKFSRQIQGELDWIVMQALDKDRTRRYESASAFAADVERYLNDEPVAACPPSAVYRLRKLARRNKVALITTALVVTSLLVGTAVSISQAYRANNAELLAGKRLTRSEENLELALRVLDEWYFFGEAGRNATPFGEAKHWLVKKYSAKDLELLALESLRLGLEFYGSLARQYPESEKLRFANAKAINRYARIELSLGHHDKAEQDFLRALDQLKKIPSSTVDANLLSIEVGLTHRWLRGLYLRKNQNEKAFLHAQMAVDADSDSPEAIYHLGQLADTYAKMGRYENALDARNRLLKLAPDRISRARC